MADHDATPSSHFRYDVFLSFRGYTRFGFTDCLYSALINKNIKTYRDNENLIVGDEIRPALAEAIEESRMSIVVLCEEYASSSWCLDELVKIMECSENGRKRPVLPIFYKVDPSDVRHQSNQYGTAMIQLENRFGKDSHKVKAWRSALFAVCELTGQHCTKDMYESEIINKIVEVVLKKLPLELLHIKHPVRLDSQLEEVESLLDIESRDVCSMLGIYGAGGSSSKTTFVVKLYNKIRHLFEVASFLANVSEKSKESINGLENLQKTLLSEMCEDVKIKIGSTFKGSSEIKRRLGHRRVFLVLDDVDDIQQLNSLAGGGDWFGLGSRIIITTRDEDVLDKHVKDGVEIKKYCIDEGGFEGMEDAKSSLKQNKEVEEDLVGFVNTFNIIIKQLKEEDPRTNIVSIIGMGGLGKTTLAQKIYNNNEVKELFSCRAWVYVSNDFKAKEFLVNLLHCLKLFKTDEYKYLSEEELKNKVGEHLKRNKYLIVLDDMWEAEVWSSVEGIFPNNKNGSRILITSRNDEVANCTSSKSHYLPFLDEKDSWELFCEKVFGREKCPFDLDSIGKSMVERCGGLPLAIVTLSGLVAKKKRLKRKWLRFKEHIDWHLAEDMTKVMEVLKLSYESLPQRLKPCFLYFRMYPKGYEILMRQLIQLWIAEGFIQPEEIAIQGAPEPEYVAEEYLDELVDRNLVQVASKRSDGGVKTCRIHDLLHDLCISENMSNEDAESVTETSFIKPHDTDLFGVSKLFSGYFTVSNSQNLKPKNLNSARVLDVGSVKLFSSILRDLETFIHLRYLDIRIFVNAFPNSICTLTNLETLYIMVRSSHLPSEIWKLKRLRHLLIFGLNPIILPANVSRADSLPNLQTLRCVAIDPQTTSLLDNVRFPKLRNLALEYNPYTMCSVRDQLRSLHRLNNLSILKLSDTADLPLDPHAFPANLTKITLRMGGNAYFFYDCISTLGCLPNLQVLKLLHGSISGSTVGSFSCVAGEFSKLEVFQMENINVQRWRLEEGAMPCLQHLMIKACSLLDELPKQLWSLTTLQDVHVVKPSLALRKSLQNVELKNGCKLMSHD